MARLTPEQLQEARKRSGRLGGRPRKAAVVEDELDSKATEAERAARRHVSDPRAELAEDLREDYELVREALRRNIKAEKEKTVSVTCKHCHREARYSVAVDDAAARNRAVEIWLNQAQGMPGQARPSVATAGLDYLSMSEEEQEAFEQAVARRIFRITGGETNGGQAT